MSTPAWAWLFDLGSTFTKLTVVDLACPAHRHAAQAPTTVATDVREGMAAAIAAIERGHGVPFAAASLRLASSSAAGGLALVVSGLVPRLSLEAGRIASLGAGAKLVGSWGYRLTASDVRAMESARPDVVLLTGGTDGGDRETLQHNARALLDLRWPAIVIVAGNREVSGDVAQVLGAAGRRTRVAPNIMPEVDRLDVEPVRTIIREVFLEEIVKAKGIDKARELVDAPILPTPYVVLQVVRLLAEDVLRSPVMVLEIGGATTNVHSFAEGAPRDAGTIRRGFAEPALKRTVEGDLGVRYNADRILELAGAEYFTDRIEGLDARALESYVARVHETPSRLPSDPIERRIDQELAGYAARAAVLRHAGRLEEIVLPTGPRFVQYGKDLRDVPAVVFTGGSVINAAAPEIVFRRALGASGGLALTPESPAFYLDRHYLLYAAGLLVLAGKPRESATLLHGSLEARGALAAATKGS